MRIKITCPLCRNTHPVYHLDWSALGCQTCDTMVKLEHWQVSASEVKRFLKNEHYGMNEILQDIARS